jgi:regulator of nucleoside diphosphate kinase
LLRRSEATLHVQDLLEQAVVLPSKSVAPDVITMNSKVEIKEASGATRTVVICWPKDAKAEAGYVSVLSPLGTALLGRKAGEQVTWTGADGREYVAEVAAVLFQPEASGDYTA